MREEVEEKGIIPSNQTGFRKRMGTIDNIYVLNYRIQRRIERKGGKLMAFFVDLRAAFDSVDRDISECNEGVRNKGRTGGEDRRIVKGNKK